MIFQYLIFSFTQTLRYWSAPFTPILSPLRPSDNEDRVQVWEKEKGIFILHIKDSCDNFDLFLKFDKIISFKLVVVTVY